MKRLYVAFFLVLFISACGKKHKKIPDVSNIKAPLTVIRTEKDIFQINGHNLDTVLNLLGKKDAAFLQDYLYQIIAIPPSEDSVRSILPRFIHDYSNINDTVQQMYTPAFLDKTLAPLKLALQLTKYYFPKYPVPTKLFTFIGPIEGYGSVLTRSGLAVGLQLYLGHNYSGYNTDFVTQVYPAYISRKFSPEYISVNCVKNILDDIDTDSDNDGTLIGQIVEEGKKTYALGMLLPELDDTLITGYTANQLKGCFENESDIWTHFIENDLLYSKDPTTARDYAMDGPNTAVFGPESPGNIGIFVGWQIVKKWTKEHPETTLQQLMQMPAIDIFKQSKYKPK